MLQSASTVWAFGEELDSEQARKECFKGATIYCLALGIAEERAGHRQVALELYRSACRNHPTPGHLRACTSVLTLAKELGRLEEEAAFLEERCRRDNPVTCFYLAKEYLRIREVDKAAVHMEPLCHRNFRPPDADDYGPCYHMAKGYQRAQRWEPAKDLFEFDCRRDAVSGHPSCQALEKMLILKEELRQAAWDRLRPVETAEGFLLLVVLMSLIHAVLWFKGGAGVLTWMIYGAPVVVWGGVLTWVYWPEKPEFPANQWAVVAFTLFLVCGLALVALYRKNFRPPSDSAFGKPPSDGISPTPAKG